MCYCTWCSSSLTNVTKGVILVKWIYTALVIANCMHYPQPTCNPPNSFHALLLHPPTMHKQILIFSHSALRTPNCTLFLSHTSWQPTPNNTLIASIVHQAATIPVRYLLYGHSICPTVYLEEMIRSCLEYMMKLLTIETKGNSLRHQTTVI